VGGIIFRRDLMDELEGIHPMFSCQPPYLSPGLVQGTTLTPCHIRNFAYFLFLSSKGYLKFKALGDRLKVTISR
jgi:hypothetical protein